MDYIKPAYCNETQVRHRLHSFIKCNTVRVLVQEHVDRIRMGEPRECFHEYDVSFFFSIFSHHLRKLIVFGEK